MNNPFTESLAPTKRTNKLARFVSARRRASHRPAVGKSRLPGSLRQP